MTEQDIFYIAIVLLMVLAGHVLGRALARLGRTKERRD